MNKKQQLSVAIAIIVAVIVWRACYTGTDKDANENASFEALTDDISYEIVDNNIVFGKNSIGTTWIQCYTIVKNTGNTNLYLDSSKYDIETSSGELVDTIKYVSAYPQVIAPGETAVYYEETVFEGDLSKQHRLIPKLDIKKADVDLISLPVSDVKMTTNDYGYAKVVGRYENNTDEKQTSIRVSVAFYDQSGDLLAIDYTSVDGVSPGEKDSFEILYSTDYFGFDTSKVKNIVVNCFPYQYQFS